MINHQALIGVKYGNLEVIGVGQTNGFRKKQLIVKCLNHPNIIPYEVTKQSLVNGSTTGCPECKREKQSTHKKSSSHIYHSFKRIIQRITDIYDKDYKNYGGRGIDIDPRYNPYYNKQGIQIAFENFYNDLGDVPDGLTIDRLDNSKGYWKDNIRFVTMAEQQQNRRNNVVNPEMVKQIREDYSTKQFTQKQLA